MKNIAQMFEGPAHNLVWKNRYNEIINDCYWNHLQHIRKESIQPLLDSGWCVEPNYPTKEEFINQIKTDDGFAKKWGVKITERNLTDKERIELMGGKIQEKYPELIKQQIYHCDKFNIPTKKCRLKYKNETVEYYE